MLKESVENSVGIEMHANRYYYDNTTSHFENLLGGYIDGEYFIPVRFGLKHIKGGSPVLYVVVDQNAIEKNKIETEVVKTTTLKNDGSAVSRSISKLKLSQIIPFVKSEDVLRYLPDDMLSQEQQEIKKNAIESTNDYTNEKNDKKYLDFLNKGNMQAVQQMVNEAAKANGYTIKAYHGTPNGGFTVFNEDKIGSNTDDGIYGSGFYFSTHENQAGQYGDIMPVYLNGGDVLSLNDVTPSELADMLNMWEGNFTIDNSTGIIRPVYSQVAQFTSHLKDAGYDSVYVDYGTSDEIIIFNSERIKSADPVTYDDNGNVIPLSQRFNEANNDIRYSLSSEDAQPVKQGDYHVTGEDVRFAPVRKDIAKKSQNKTQKSGVLRMLRHFVRILLLRTLPTPPMVKKLLPVRILPRSLYLLLP